MTETLATSGARQLFFYWRVAPDQVDTGLSALQAWQAELMQSMPMLLARLFVRSDSDAGRVTVMETYAIGTSGPGIDSALEVQLRAQGDALSASLRDGPRQLEAFDELLPQSTTRPASSRS